MSGVDMAGLIWLAELAEVKICLSPELDGRLFKITGSTLRRLCVGVSACSSVGMLFLWFRMLGCDGMVGVLLLRRNRQGGVDCCGYNIYCCQQHNLMPHTRALWLDVDDAGR